MYNIMNIGKTGLKSMQFKMDALADELANINTIGYKKKDISFQELLNNETFDNEVLRTEDLNLNINIGSKSGIGTINFEQGITIQSPSQYHMALEGKGFFGLRDEMGNLMLTRNGAFNLNQEGSISDDNGYPLELDLNKPIEEWGNGTISISSNGEISIANNQGTEILGRVILYSPEVLDSLKPLGEGRYLPSESVALYNSRDDNERFGIIIQNSLEGSNVEILKTMMDMIVTQRAYSLNNKAIQTTDDIMSMINDIKQ